MHWEYSFFPGMHILHSLCVPQECLSFHCQILREDIYLKLFQELVDKHQPRFVFVSSSICPLPASSMQILWISKVPRWRTFSQKQSRNLKSSLESHHLYTWYKYSSRKCKLFFWKTVPFLLYVAKLRDALAISKSETINHWLTDWLTGVTAMASKNIDQMYILVKFISIQQNVNMKSTDRLRQFSDSERRKYFPKIKNKKKN